MIINKLDNYEKMEQLGNGTYGVVYKARDKTTGQFYALKKIKLESQDQGIPSTAIRQISILLHVNHPNIVKLHNVIHQNKKLILVFEYVDMDLKKFMAGYKEKGMSQQIVRDLIYQLLKGIEYCHKNQILHRDLKPQNLLINSKNVLKLADFGLARTFGIPVKGYTHQVVTLWYRPPDVLFGFQKYNSTIDIWSVGCIFAQLSNLKPLFPGSKQEDQLQKIFKVVGSPDPAKWPGVQTLPYYKADKYQGFQAQPLSKLVPKLSQDGIELLQRMLRSNPAQRINASEALKHPYFQKVSKQVLQIYKH